jgi:hypothetical protein
VLFSNLDVNSSLLKSTTGKNADVIKPHAAASSVSEGLQFMSARNVVDPVVAISDEGFVSVNKRRHCLGKKP